MPPCALSPVIWPNHGENCAARDTQGFHAITKITRCNLYIIRVNAGLGVTFERIEEIENNCEILDFYVDWPIACSQWLAPMGFLAMVVLAMVGMVYSNYGCGICKGLGNDVQLKR